MGLHNSQDSPGGTKITTGSYMPGLYGELENTQKKIGSLLDGAKILLGNIDIDTLKSKNNGADGEQEGKKLLKIIRLYSFNIIKSELLSLHNGTSDMKGVDQYTEELLESDGSLKTKSKEKIFRCLRRYELAVTKKFQQELGKSSISDGDNNSHKNIVEECFKKSVRDFLNIFSIYGDSLDLESFEELLLGETDEDSDTYNLKQILKIYGKFSGNPSLQKAVRKLVGKMQREGIQFSTAELGERLEKHFIDIFIDRAKVFKIIANGLIFTPDDFLKLGNAFSSLRIHLEDIKQEEIGFLNVSESELLNYLFSSSSERLEGVLNGPEELSDFKEFMHQDTESIHEYLNRLHEKLRQANQSLEFSQIDNIDNDSITFSEYQNAGPIGRKKYFLEKILVLDEAKQNITSNHNLPSVIGENVPIFDNFLEFYSKYYKKHGLEKFDILNLYTQGIKLIESAPSEGLNLDTFELEYFEEEQVLIAWYRFFLVWHSNASMSTHDKMRLAKELWDELYGIKEVYCAEKQIEGELPPNFTRGSTENIAFKNIDELLTDGDKKLENLEIDINDPGFCNSQGEYFYNINSLYLPNDTNIEPRELESFYKRRIELLNIVSEKGYIEEKDSAELKEIENSGINLTNFQEIFMYRKFLKYCLYFLSEFKKEAVAARVGTDYLKKNLAVLGDINIEYGEVKRPHRYMQKLMEGYKGDSKKVGDSGRARVISKDLDASVNDLHRIIQVLSPKELISQYVVEDGVGNINERSQKPSGYSDIVLKIRFKNGSCFEIQFLTEKMHNYKVHGIDSYELVDKAQKKGISFTLEEHEELKKASLKTGKDLANGISALVIGYEEEKVIGLSENSGEKISSDYLYHLLRFISNEELKQKLRSLESIPYKFIRAEEANHLSHKALGK